MKQKILMIIMIFIFPLLLPMAGGEIYAWDDCPKGMVNDEYPGSCPLYVDTDGNGICDHSEPAPKDRVNNQDFNKEIMEKETGNPVALANNKKGESLVNNDVLSFLSIFIPLIIIVGYAGFYKIKQGKKS